MKHTVIVLCLLILTAGPSYGQTIDFELMSITSYGSIGERYPSSTWSPSGHFFEFLTHYGGDIKEWYQLGNVDIANGTAHWPFAQSPLHMLKLKNDPTQLHGILVGPTTGAGVMTFHTYSLPMTVSPPPTTVYATVAVTIYDATMTVVSQEAPREVVNGDMPYVTGIIPAGGYVRIWKPTHTLDLWIDNISDPTLIPVELTAFSARSFDNSVKLTWQTATELNNYGFDVERSVDGKNWNALGFVAGHGNSFSPKSYAFTDELDADAKLASKIVYRLKQIDRDGTTDYSNVVIVNRGALAKGVELLNAYPNPFNPSTTINFSLDEATVVSVQVYDMYGRNVSTLVDNASFDAGVHTVAFNAGSLTSGTYFVLLNAAGVVRQQRIVLSK